MKLIAYPGNQTYKSHFDERLLVFDKNFKSLKVHLEKTADQKIIELLISMAIKLQIMHSAQTSMKEKFEAIKALELYCNNLEVSLEEGLADSADILSPALQALLGKSFEIEFKDLRLVFNKSGTCTAFLLRKMLEKAAYIALSKIGKSDELIDANGKSKGLQTLLDMATKEKTNSHHLMMAKTNKMIQGIKFLGDSAAHNPLIIVDDHEIVPQLPFISVALKELGTSISETES
ncbi:hypothetical protein HY772_09770 [Candidatus Woesearchaeota archaeon]|nr:hypothetical protein [Candidatus Woesearchaeota archaeon]